MSFLGLDWGNVPSWFSAASFSAAAYVIIRDRTHKKRQQIDNAGFWGEVSLVRSTQASEEQTRITPVLHVKNASNLPLYVIEVKYEVSGLLNLEPSEDILRSGVPFHFDGRMGHSTIPPGETKKIEGESERMAGHFFDPETQQADVWTMKLAMIIKEIRIQDNSGSSWKLHPKTGSSEEYFAAIRAAKDQIIASGSAFPRNWRRFR